MNYEPNQAAVSLATRRSRKIGIIISDLTNPHISSLFMAIEREIQKNGYMLLCHVLENEPAENTISYLQRMLSNDIAGLIWCKPIVETPPRSARRQDGSSMEVRCAKDEPVECERQQLREYMDRLGIPVITMDESGFSCGGIDVVFDYNEAAYLATRHLLELGHRRIGCVAGTQDFKVTQDRLDGYSKALAEEGIPFDEELIYKGNYTLKSGKQSLSYLLGKRVSAIFSMNDEMAFGIYQSARMYGVRIPDDLSVIGCDNVPFGDSLEVPLSTLNVPAEEMGQLIGKKMIEAVERFEGKDKKRMIINYRPTLLVKGSTARYGREAE